MSNLDITNVVTVEVATPPLGLADYQINNIGYFTKETPLNSIPSFAVYLSPSAVATDWGVGSETYAAAVAIFSQSPNILEGGGSFITFPMAGGDTLTSKITAVNELIFFGGILYGGYTPINSELIAAAATCQALRKLIFLSSYLISDLSSPGLFYTISPLKETYARMLLYTLVDAPTARLFACAYAGRAMSTDFNGSATCETMHLKDLAGVAPDTGITQTILTTCETLGVDVYASIAGLPKVFSTGGNEYFDNVYNLTAFINDLQVAEFNALATTPTKIPQTEPGVALLRGAALDVCQQYAINGFIAPGAWKSPELFGNPAALLANILQFGFYVYSNPVNQQSQANRVARKSPPLQIAIKYAGAIQSVDVIVNINV